MNDLVVTMPVGLADGVLRRQLQTVRPISVARVELVDANDAVVPSTPTMTFANVFIRSIKHTIERGFPV